MENHKNVSYREIIDIINSDITTSSQVREEFWTKLSESLLTGISNSIVAQYIKKFIPPDNDPKKQGLVCFDDYLSVFVEQYLSDRLVLEAKLEAICQDNPEPGKEFLDWLLNDYLTSVIKEYKNQVTGTFITEATKDEIFWTGQSTGEEESTSLPPDSYERDKAERAKNPVAFSRNHIVQLALITITRKMSKKNWKNETQFKQPGLQMYPFLHDRAIQLEVKEVNLLQQLGENVENYVSELHGTQKNFCPTSYLTEVHEQASRQLAIIRQKWEERSRNTRNFSSHRRNENRKGIKIVTDAWLAPLDNSLVAEVCKVDIRSADHLLSRYKSVFLSEIYHTVNNYREDKDV